MRRALLPFALSLAMIAATGGCSPGGVTVQDSVSNVYDELRALPAVPPGFEKAFGGKSWRKLVRVESAEDRSVSWILSREGKEYARYTVTLTPDGDAATIAKSEGTITDPAVSSIVKNGVNLGDYTKQVAFPILDEHVGALLEDRLFNDQKAMGYVLAFALTNRDFHKGLMANLDEAHKEEMAANEREWQRD